jgi:hypothetical protein
MSLARFWSSFKLLNLSKPAGDRPLYRLVRGKRIESVLEVNVGDGVRCQRLVAWLREQVSPEQSAREVSSGEPSQSGVIRYAAIDAFETGGAGHLTLKAFHSHLGRLGVKPLPVPDTGNLAAALARVAHSIGCVDLAIFDCSESSLQDPTVAAILSRVVKDDSLVLVRNSEGTGLRAVSASELANLRSRKTAA